jgi:hypothetical protein
MSSARLYRRYLKLCETWGVDSSKSGRDLGEHIRKEVGKAFAKGELSQIPNLEECEKKLESLERIANNKYYRPSDAELPTASGATRQECHAIVSNDGLKASQSLYESPYLTRLLVRWNSYRGSKRAQQKNQPIEDATKK